MSKTYKAFVVVHFEVEDGNVDPWADGEDLVNAIREFTYCDAELKDIEEEI